MCQTGKEKQYIKTEHPLFDTTRSKFSVKILHLISSTGLYGAERVALDLCKSLKRYGCESIIGVIKNSHNPHVEVADEARKNSIDAVIFPCEGQLDVKLILRIRKYASENQINLVHCHGYKSNFYGLFACPKDIPIVATNHNWLASHWRLRAYRRFDSLLIRCFTRIIAVSEGVMEEMLKYGVPKEKIRVIDNGIDLTRFDDTISPEAIREEFGIKKGVRVIGTVGNLGAEKGHVYLLQAAKGIVNNVESVKFFFVGDGPLRAYLENEASELGIGDNIIFTGFRTDIPNLLSAMDIFVLPSVIEGLPMVLLEAMAAKKAVVATSVGAISKVVNNGNGILVEPRDVAGLQNAILSLLTSEEKRQKYASAGHDTVRTHFSSERMSSEYIDVYKELLRGRLLL
jgi:glycosyltransferase involved in cell wall biosynthesis